MDEATSEEASGSSETALGRKARVDSPLCLKGCPEPRAGLGTGAKNRLLRREIYVLSNNPDTKFADWVAYRATRDTIGRSRRTPWTADPALDPDATLEPEDYKGAHAKLGTDRGHQVPLATFSGTDQAFTLNYLSNATPQRGQLNQRSWNHLEQAVRDLVWQPDIDAVYGVTGPLFEREMPALPGADEPHSVPSGYFKILSIQEGERLSVAAFIMDQETDGRSRFCAHQVTVRQVEERSGWDFFVSLPEELEERLETEQGRLGARLGCP
jgi:endonuclease G